MKDIDIEKVQQCPICQKWITYCLTEPSSDNPRMYGSWIRDKQKFWEDNKTYLTSNTFKYLYEINCQFEEESFTDTNDLTTKITDIITQNKFGENLKKLSDFIKKPEHDINEWFYKNKIKDISVTGFKFDPEMKNIPCKNLTFTFTMTVNEQDDVELIIKKLSVGRFKFTFKIFDKSFDIDKPSLTTLIETIGETLKDKYQK